MEKYIFLYRKCNPEMNLYSYILADLFKLDNVEYAEISKKEIKNPIIKLIRKVHLSYKISKIIKLPFKRIWYNLPKIDLKNEEDQYYIIMPIGVFWECDISTIKSLKKNKNIKFVLLLLDTMGLKSPASELINRVYKNKMWDYIFSYDENDARKYNFIPLNYHYYSMQKKEEVEKRNDAYFIGGLKPGRTKELIELFEYLKNNNVNVKFDVAKGSGKTLTYENEGFNILEKRKPYSYIIDEVNASNCIIEILEEGQNSPSLKYFEAVTLKKKLLTNNKNIENLPFYNENYMKKFEKIEDINITWIKQEENINYNYNGEFSPLYIIEKIEEMENK